MESIDNDVFAAQCKERIYAHLLAQPHLASCLQRRNQEECNMVDLGIWLGIVYKKRLANAKPVRNYECALIVAIKDGERGSEEMLVDTGFLISRPFEQEENILEIEKRVIDEALKKASNIISDACGYAS